MKILLASIFLIITLVSCSDIHKDEVTITGSISNPKSEFVFITIADSLIKSKLDQQNNFKLEVKIKREGYFRFDHGEHTIVYLKPNEDLHIELDANRFDETIKYNGSLGKLNNYLSLNVVDNETLKKLSRDKYYCYKKDLFNNLIDSIVANRQSRLKECSDESDSIFWETENNNIRELEEFYLSNYDKMNLISKGKPAPEFISQDISGNRISINNFKNKYKVIDVWATWCIGCRKESPIFEKLAQKYKNKNIEFIGLSVDEDMTKWEIATRGDNSNIHQLWIPDVMNSEFVKKYNVPECGVPFFIIIDKDNKIVNARAPRPSDKLEEVLLSLL